MSKYFIFYVSEGKLIKYGESFNTYDQAEIFLKEKIAEGIGRFENKEWVILKVYY